MFKRELVARSLVPGASVAAVALEAGINSNLLFAWRRMHRGVQAQNLPPTPSGSPVLLPVTIEAAPVAACPEPAAPRQTSGTIEIVQRPDRLAICDHLIRRNCASCCLVAHNFGKCIEAGVYFIHTRKHAIGDLSRRHFLFPDEIGEFYGGPLPQLRDRLCLGGTTARR
ncbi:transposase [Hydrogenophaga sp.]|uniref:transposase n=1 Tax=Hydrogenophaga sp. TaxID=1904254 RepID=UPI002FCB49C3